MRHVRAYWPSRLDGRCVCLGRCAAGCRLPDRAAAAPVGIGRRALTTLLFSVVLFAGHFALLRGALLVPLVALPVGHLLLLGKRLLMPGADAAAPAPGQKSLPTTPDRPAVKPEEALPAGIGRYRIDRKLGGGAMGEVYLGRDSKTETLAAIKTLALTRAPSRPTNSPTCAHAFREAETAGRLHHPDIVAILDAGEDGGLAFIAMEFLLRQQLRPFYVPIICLSPKSPASARALPIHLPTLTPATSYIAT